MLPNAWKAAARGASSLLPLWIVSLPAAAQNPYFHNGRSYRLTDVAGNVLTKILT